MWIVIPILVIGCALELLFVDEPVPTDVAALLAFPKEHWDGPDPWQAIRDRWPTQIAFESEKGIDNQTLDLLQIEIEVGFDSSYPRDPRDRSAADRLALRG